MGDFTLAKAASCLALQRAIQRRKVAAASNSVGKQAGWLENLRAGANPSGGPLENNLWESGRNALLGASAGGLVGLGRNLFSQERRPNLLQDMLTGGLLGGTLAGGGTLAYRGLRGAGSDAKAQLEAQQQAQAAMQIEKQELERQRNAVNGMDVHAPDFNTAREAYSANWLAFHRKYPGVDLNPPVAQGKPASDPRTEPITKPVSMGEMGETLGRMGLHLVDSPGRIVGTIAEAGTGGALGATAGHFGMDIPQRLWRTATGPWDVRDAMSKMTGREQEAFLQKSLANSSGQPLNRKGPTMTAAHQGLAELNRQATERNTNTSFFTGLPPDRATPAIPPRRSIGRQAVPAKPGLSASQLQVMRRLQAAPGIQRLPSAALNRLGQIGGGAVGAFMLPALDALLTTPNPYNNQ